MVDLLAPIVELIAALEQRQVSARELLEGYVARIEQLDGPINAVVTLDVERAAAEAAAIDDARLRGEAVGPLAGVPITVKDAIATQGIRSTGGSAELTDHVPEADAAAVRRLREAGAVVFGKTNLPEWSADVQTFNQLFGTTNNPWSVDHTPGGSSGGAATATAMGFTAFELGTDIGGSVRIPASNCGVYGHKPSFGIVPTDGYLDAPDGGLAEADVNVFGPFARSIDDLELLFDVLIGPNDVDAVGWRLELPPARARELDELRVGVWLDHDFCPVEPEVGDVLQAAVDRLSSAGCRLLDRRPDLDVAAAAWVGMTLISAATEISDTDDEWIERAERGGVVSHRRWNELDRLRASHRRAWSELFAEIDVLLCPVAPTPPIRHVQSSEGSNFQHSVLADYGDRPYHHLVGWTSLVGSAYLPVTVPPAGRTAEGLPIGVQVVGPFLEDRTPLAFARLMTEAVGDFEPPPAAR